MTLLAMTTAALLALSLAPPPPPPLGWETEITEGFDPPIEEVLVDHFYAADAVRQAHAEAWGAAAVPILQRLYADPKWRSYRPAVRLYLDQFDAPTKAEGVMERLEEVLQTFDPHEWQQHEALSIAVRDAMRLEPERTRAMVLEAYAVADESRQVWLLQLIPFSDGQEGMDLLRIVEEAAASERMRDMVTGRIRSREASERVREPIAWILERERGEDTP